MSTIRLQYQQQQQETQVGKHLFSKPPLAQTTPNSSDRDYTRENRAAIKDLEQELRSHKAFEEEIRQTEAARAAWKMRRFSDVKGKVADMVKRQTHDPPSVSSSSSSSSCCSSSSDNTNGDPDTKQSSSFLLRGALNKRIQDKTVKARHSVLLEAARQQHQLQRYAHPHVQAQMRPYTTPARSNAAAASSSQRLLQQRKPSVPRAHELAPLTRPAVPKNHIMENRRAAIQLSSSACCSSSSSSSSSSVSSSWGASNSNNAAAAAAAVVEKEEGPHRHKAYGRIPSYLLTRKQEWATAEALKLAAEKSRHGGIPPGMRLLTEAERQEALQAIEAQEREIHAALLKIPLRVDTPSMAKKKQQLDEKLAEVTRSKEIFAKPRILIKIE